MATRNETHVHDLSTLANFKDWAQSISNALTAFGWTLSSDTGQVNWGSIASVPASGNYVYEIWQPGDGLATFYVRIDYGNNGGNPGLKIQCGTTTNGSGTLTGFTATQGIVLTAGNSGSSVYNCLYCGDTSSFAMMMWRDHTTANFVIGVDRSRNSSGAATASYFTQFCARDNSINGNPFTQQSVMFGVGAANRTGVSDVGSNANANFNTIIGGALTTASKTPTSLAFNGNIAFCPVFPLIGYYDNPTLTFGHASTVDFAELAVLTTTMFGATHSFIFTKNGNLVLVNTPPTGGIGLAMRWE